MEEQKPMDEKGTLPLVPVKSIMDWKPPSETVAAIVNLVGNKENQLQLYKTLCGKEHQ